MPWYTQQDFTAAVQQAVNAAVPQAVTQAVQAGNYQDAIQVAQAINTNTNLMSVVPGVYRVEVAPSLLTVLNGIGWTQRVDRTVGSSIAGSLTLTSLTLGTLTLSIKVNGVQKATVTIPAAQANQEQTFSIPQGVVAGDVLRIDVTGLGTTPGYLFGYLKAS